MTILLQVLLVLHFVGMASLLGGVIAQIPAVKKGTAVINSAIFHGGLTALVSGVLMVGVVEMAHLFDINNFKIGVKLLIMIVITVLAIVYRKKTPVKGAIILTIGGLTLINIILAVFWR